MSQPQTIAAVLLLCASGAFTSFRAAAQSQAESPRPKMIRVAGAVMLVFIEHRALPEYPEQALRAGIEGDVIFKIVVDETGKVVLAKPVEGDPLLVATSTDALRTLQFRPYLLNGQPVRVETQLGFHFVARKNRATNGQVEYLTAIPSRPEFRTGVLTEKGVEVLWPRKVSGSEPRLSPELVGKAGSVYLAITIGEDGKVQDVKVLGGDEPFIGPVVEAVKQFVYEPQLIDGKPSVSTTQASYHFGPRH